MVFAVLYSVTPRYSSCKMILQVSYTSPNCRAVTKKTEDQHMRNKVDLDHFPPVGYADVYFECVAYFRVHSLAPSLTSGRTFAPGGLNSGRLSVFNNAPVCCFK